MFLWGRGCAGPSVSTVPGAECPTELTAAPLPAVTVVFFLPQGPKEQGVRSCAMDEPEPPAPAPEGNGHPAGALSNLGVLGEKGRV